MTKVFYVQDTRTGRILNQKGGWSRDIKSYRVAEFESAEAASAAFPEGFDCRVATSNRKED